MSTTEAETTAPPAAATPPPTPPKAAAKSTEYVVLEQGVDKGWADVGKQTARSPKAAVAAHVTEKKLAEGTFVAVPARSWDPIKVKTETQTKLAFS